MKREHLLVPELPGQTRAWRVRWILALDEAGKLGRPADWDEWNRIWFGAAGWTHAGALKAFKRLRTELLEFGVMLPARRERWVNATSPEIRALVVPWVHTARRLEVELEARRRGETPDLVPLRREAAGLRAAEVAAFAARESEVKVRHKSNPYGFRALKRALGIGDGRLGYLLRCAGAAPAPRRRRLLEDSLTAATVEQALATHDHGGSLRDVARVLGVERAQSASRFLARHGRTRRKPRRRSVPPRADSSQAH